MTKKLVRVTQRVTRWSVLWVVLLALAVTASLSLPTSADVQSGVGQEVMVASAHPLASEAGVEILRKGGNAIDAAVAVGFALGIVEPHASGLGGEGMMVVYLAETGEKVAIDFRSRAPLSATYAAFPGGLPTQGYAAVAVPGLVAGLAEAQQRYGRLTLEEVLEPAIRIAEEGFVVDPILAGLISDNYLTWLEDPEGAAAFLVDDFPPFPGDTIKNVALANVIKAIATEGPDVYYTGWIADQIVAAMSEHGGLITHEDLATYEPIIRTPVEGTYRGHQIISAPPPVSGLTVIETLHIMDNFDFTGHAYPSKYTIHIMAEALKRGFRDYTANMGDPAFWDVPVRGLSSPEYGAARAAEIDPEWPTPGRPPIGNPLPYESPSTTHVSIVDGDGNMVAMTQTLSSFFGARVMVPGTGMLLNNEMMNFSTQPGLPNSLLPGKRMRTTIAPTLVLKDGQPFLTIGTPGAGRIVSTVVLLLSLIIDHDMTLEEALNAPRFYARDSEVLTHMEGRIPEQIRRELEDVGYILQVYDEYDLFFGGAQGVLIDPETGLRYGAADPRRVGGVSGY